MKYLLCWKSGRQIVHTYCVQTAPDFRSTTSPPPAKEELSNLYRAEPQITPSTEKQKHAPKAEIEEGQRNFEVLQPQIPQSSNIESSQSLIYDRANILEGDTFSNPRANIRTSTLANTGQIAKIPETSHAPAAVNKKRPTAVAPAYNGELEIKPATETYPTAAVTESRPTQSTVSHASHATTTAAAKHNNYNQPSIVPDNKLISAADIRLITATTSSQIDPMSAKSFPIYES